MNINYEFISKNVNAEDDYQYCYCEMYRHTHLYDELISQIERNMHYCITAILYNKLFYHVKTV